MLEYPLTQYCFCGAPTISGDVMTCTHCGGMFHKRCLFLEDVPQDPGSFVCFICLCYEATHALRKKILAVCNLYENEATRRTGCSCSMRWLDLLCSSGGIHSSIAVCAASGAVCVVVCGVICGV